MTLFSRRSYAFLRDLAENNTRDWFQENRDRYESDLREPAQRFIVGVGERLDEISPELRADPRGNGGSLFRIHRDVRFSKDKSPYKTHAGIQFRHAAGKDAHAPGLYLHVEPSGSFFAAGVWRPASPQLRAIRERIVEVPQEWRSAVHTESFGETWDLEGDSLVRMPRGFDPDHPLAEDLRRKDFIAVTRLTQKQVVSPDLPNHLIDLALGTRPLLRFICEAIDVRF